MLRQKKHGNMYIVTRTCYLWYGFYERGFYVTCILVLIGSVDSVAFEEDQSIFKLRPFLNLLR